MRCGTCKHLNRPEDMEPCRSCMCAGGNGARWESAEPEPVAQQPAPSPLLDTFAAAALTGLLSGRHYEGSDGGKKVSEASYDLAEAMLAERAKRGAR